MAVLAAWIVKSRLGGDADVMRVRRVLDGLSFTPRGVAFTPARYGAVGGEAAAVGPSGGKPRLFYVHGGGFIAGAPHNYRPVTGAFARRGFDVFAPAYRLAPEHPFPAALDDVVAAWRAFAAEGPAVVAGDSAGGTLALGLMLRARDEGLPVPRAAALFSPATDLVGTGASIVENAARDTMLDLALLKKTVPLYLGDADPCAPLVSPLRAELAGLPPLLLHVGCDELLRDDSIRLADKARDAGVEVAIDLFPAVPHVWQWADGLVPEARQSLDAAAAFLCQRLGA